MGYFLADLEGTAARFGRLGFTVSPVNIQYNSADGELVQSGTANRLIVFEAGHIEALAALLPEAHHPPPPFGAAVDIESADLDRTRALLAEAGAACHGRPDRLLVPRGSAPGSTSTAPARRRCGPHDESRGLRNILSVIYEKFLFLGLISLRSVTR